MLFCSHTVTDIGEMRKLTIVNSKLNVKDLKYFFYSSFLQSVHQLLPPTYRNVWLEWSDTEKKKEEENKMETNKPRDQFIAKLLNKLKQQQPQQQFESKPKLSEDAEDSWENLVSEDDFSGLSLENPVVDDLEPARALFKKLQSTPRYQRLLKEREQLPVFKYRHSIVETLKKHRVVVVAGETGSGKSTQVPHFLLEDLLLSERNLSKCNIVCTQPRRISAVSLATRVCEELGCESGPGGRVSCSLGDLLGDLGDMCIR